MEAPASVAVPHWHLVGEVISGVSDGLRLLVGIPDRFRALAGICDGLG